METVCLIIPPSVFLLDERVFMSLGILRIAACLEKAGHQVEMLDLSGIKNYTDVVRLYAASSKSKIFGLTATTPQMPATFEITQALRKARPDGKIILGGPHITLVNAAYKREKSQNIHGRAEAAFHTLEALYDVLVAGDGEESIFLAIKPDAPKVIDADDPASPLFLNNERLNELPFPARHLLDVGSYNYTIDGVRALSLIAQLGCPFECGFCGGRASPMLRRIRMRNSQSVVDELKEIYQDYHVEGFMLYDDELNVNNRMIELMTLIAQTQKDLGVQWRLRGFIKSQLFTDAQAEAMRQAGFKWILTGFESGSPRILQNINKRATRDENTRCIEIARRHGLKVKALMSVGHPGESEETIRETHDWLVDVKPDDFDVTIITTYPGTPYYDLAVRDAKKPDIWAYTFKTTGDRLYSQEVDYTRVAEYYKGNPDGGYKSYVYTDYLSAERLVELRDWVERDVRLKLNIPFNSSAASRVYEHSMGQQGLPPSILRTSAGTRLPLSR